ncbi:MAG: hypothetical protein R2883_05765, partial [Caldisericia bacterium]
MKSFKLQVINLLVVCLLLFNMVQVNSTEKLVDDDLFFAWRLCGDYCLIGQGETVIFALEGSDPYNLVFLNKKTGSQINTNKIVIEGNPGYEFENYRQIVGDDVYLLIEKKGDFFIKKYDIDGNETLIHQLEWKNTYPEEFIFELPEFRIIDDALYFSEFMKGKETFVLRKYDLIEEKFDVSIETECFDLFLPVVIDDEEIIWIGEYDIIKSRNNEILWKKRFWDDYVGLDGSFLHYGNVSNEKYLFLYFLNSTEGCCVYDSLIIEKESGEIVENAIEEPAWSGFYKFGDKVVYKSGEKISDDEWDSYLYCRDISTDDFKLVWKIKLEEGRTRFRSNYSSRPDHLFIL